jgi:hypothetical protein
LGCSWQLWCLQHVVLSSAYRVQVIVQGIKTVERAVINQNKDKTYGLLVEGTDLQVRGWR